MPSDPAGTGRRQLELRCQNACTWVTLPIAPAWMRSTAVRNQVA